MPADVSDNLDGRAILASLPIHVPESLGVDVPLAVLPCLRVDDLLMDRRAGVE